MLEIRKGPVGPAHVSEPVEPVSILAPFCYVEEVQKIQEKPKSFKTNITLVNLVISFSWGVYRDF